MGKYTFEKILFFVGKIGRFPGVKFVIFSIDKAAFFGYIYTKS